MLTNLPLVGNVLGDYYTVKQTGLQYYWSKVAGVGPISNWKVLNQTEGGGGNIDEEPYVFAWFWGS